MTVERVIAKSHAGDDLTKLFNASDAGARKRG